jgi:crotonobetainyl-CoA:carnitine CoA-transferase CaiB-like acyl-CoA transferase
MTGLPGSEDDVEALLGNIRVLEVSIYGFVPSAGALLADWGADVVKVEHPEMGDPIRNLSSFGFKPGDGGVTALWEVFNRGKLSIGIDIRNKAGLALVLELVDQSDVFLTNFMPETCERLGIGPDSVRARNPRIVYGRGTAFGPSGPDANKGGFDGLVYWGLSGAAISAMSPGDKFPVPLPGPAFGDIQCGAHLAHGVVAGLYRRERTGDGCIVDVSLLSGGLWAMQASIAGAYSMGRDGIVQSDRKAPPNPLVNAYRSSDGESVSLGLLESDRYWPGLCKALDRTDLLDDVRFLDHGLRSQNSAACVAELERTIGAMPYAELKARLQSQEAPWSRIGKPIDAVTSEQALANGFVQVVNYPGGATLPLVTPPARIAGHVPTLRPAPAHAEHTDQVLARLGRDEEAIMALKLDGVVT